MGTHRGYSGKFVPQFPKKYKGNISNIVYRSLWELRAMKTFDLNPNVLEWNSEEVVIPYFSPIDGKAHRYYPDFLIKIRTKNNNIEIILIEVKPKKFCQAPKPNRSKRKTKRYVNEVVEWGKNSAKWKSAESYCRKMGWKFKILTEKELC
jgi:hypothetical protein